MEWIEVTAKSLDEAVELALDRLGVVDDELEYEVLDEPRSGILGMGRVNARIRARVKPLSREKPVDRRRRRRGESRSGGNGRGRETAPAKVGGGSGGGRGRDRSGSAEGGPPERASGSSRRRRGRGRSGSGTREHETDGDTSRANGSGRESEGDQVDHTAVLTIDEQAGEATRFTDELIQAFGLDARVAAEVVDDDIELRVDGSGLGVLVGPKGATLHALEELIRAVVQHAAGGQSARLHLDVAGYRQRRREALAAFAIQVANEVLDSGTEKALEPMTPPDRKVVHDTVAELDGVATASVGEEPRRRVVIKPA
jgi:spoIIIJ-associated protein